MLTIAPTDLPGNTHDVSPGNPARVTGSRYYRMSWATVVERGDPRFDALAGVFPEPHRPAGAFGTAGLESQEHSALWIGDPSVVVGFAGDPQHVVPWTEMAARGAYADCWPNSEEWLELIPPGTWFPGGQGIVASYPLDDGAVIVYELPGRPTLLSAGGHGDPRGPVPVVTYHCTRCHNWDDDAARYMSAHPDDRRAACRDARRHMLPGRCQGPAAAARNDQVLAAVRSAARDAQAPTGTTGTYAAYCQATAMAPADPRGRSSCAGVSQARAAQHRYQSAAGPARHLD